MKIVVTGGAGFVGSNLCKALLEQGHYVICVDNLYTGLKNNIVSLLQNSQFRFIEHDVIKPFVLEEHIDQIYNLACPASPPHYQKDSVYTTKTSVLGMMHMLDLAQKNNATILQASTSEVYGDPVVHPQPETYRGNVNPIGIRSCYDEGKRVAETLCFDYHRQYNTKVRVIRIFNTYGPNMDPKDGRVVSNFINQALLNQDITIYGDGTQTRSFQYVDDLVKGMILMMNNSQGFIGPVNIGTQYEYTMKELAEIILHMIPGKTSRIIYKSLPSDDPKQRRANNMLAKEKLGWEPTITLQEGLTKTIAYFKSLGLS